MLSTKKTSPSPWTFNDGGVVYSHSPFISWVKHSSHHRPDVEWINGWLAGWIKEDLGWMDEGVDGLTSEWRRCGLRLHVLQADVLILDCVRPWNNPICPLLCVLFLSLWSHTLFLRCSWTLGPRGALPFLLQMEMSFPHPHYYICAILEWDHWVLGCFPEDNSASSFWGVSSELGAHEPGSRNLSGSRSPEALLPELQLDLSFSTQSPTSIFSVNKRLRLPDSSSIVSEPA